MSRRYGPKAPVTAGPIDMRGVRRSGGARVASFLRKHVVTPKGAGAGDPFVLRPWQRKIVNALFDDPRPRAGLVSIPRGNGKSTLAAALGLYGLFADDEPSPQVIVVASDERQASIVREIARRMVELSPELAARAQIFKDRIRTPLNDGTFMSLPADPAALHGWDPSLLVVDELHVVSEDIWEAVSSAAGKRAKSLTLAISTPAASRDSVMWRLIEQDRVAPDASFYVAEFGAPTGCDLDDESAWEVANPALDDFLHRDALAALSKTMRPATFRRLRLGQWIEDSEAWISHADWTACAEQRDLAAAAPRRRGASDRGQPIVIGFDGSVGDDSTALVGCTVEERPHLFVLGVWEKPAGPTAREWRVPRDEVTAAIDEAFDRFDVLELACDPFAWRSEIDRWAEKHGRERVLEFPTNQARRMAPATERFYGMVAEGKLSHADDERLTRHVLAAVVATTASGDTIRKDRRWSPRKIDLAVASVIALERAVWHRLNGRRRSGRTVFG